MTASSNPIHPECESDSLGYPVIDLPKSVVSTTESVIRFMIGQLAEQGRISREHATRAICQVVTRESQGATAVGRGVAMPHSKSEVEGVIGLVGRSTLPLPWHAPDGVSVREVWLLLTPAGQPRQCLQAFQDAAAVLSHLPPTPESR